MISLQEIVKYYPSNLHSFKNFILREYLQFKILEIIFESKYNNKLCFLGGTCLRMVHNNNRFSEDIDFDNTNLTESDFKEIASLIKRKLHSQGYETEIENIFSGAFHCYIKFPKLLFNEKLTGHSGQKILIQLDTEPQHFNFTPEIYILNKFDVFTTINTTPPDILLSQKLFALLNRKRKKGRDFYDIVFLLKTTKPNFDYLEQKTGLKTIKELKENILQVCNSIHLDDIAKDVEPFLFYPAETKTIKQFPLYIQQVLN